MSVARGVMGPLVAAILVVVAMVVVAVMAANNSWPPCWDLDA